VDKGLEISGQATFNFRQSSTVVSGLSKKATFPVIHQYIFHLHVEEVGGGQRGVREIQR